MPLSVSAALVGEQKSLLIKEISAIRLRLPIAYSRVATLANIVRYIVVCMLSKGTNRTRRECTTTDSEYGLDLKGRLPPFSVSMPSLMKVSFCYN